MRRRFPPTACPRSPSPGAQTSASQALSMPSAGAMRWRAYPRNRDVRARSTSSSSATVSRWNRLLRHYLKTRAALRRVCLLIDARHGIKQTDRPILRLLDECGLSYQVVLTKLDKLRAPEIEAVIRTTAAELARHPAAHPEIHLTSAREGRGVAALRAVLGSFAEASPSSALARPAMRG